MLNGIKIHYLKIYVKYIIPMCGEAGIGFSYKIYFSSDDE